MQNPREGKISCLVLRKMSVQEISNAINWVAESIESIADKISTKNKSPLPPETNSPNQKMIYLGEMTVKMVRGILKCEEKYLLKLWIQKDIVILTFL